MKGNVIRRSISDNTLDYLWNTIYIHAFEYVGRISKYFSWIVIVKTSPQLVLEMQARCWRLFTGLEEPVPRSTCRLYRCSKPETRVLEDGETLKRLFIDISSYSETTFTLIVSHISIIARVALYFRFFRRKTSVGTYSFAKGTFIIAVLWCNAYILIEEPSKFILRWSCTWSLKIGFNSREYKNIYCGIFFIAIEWL